MPKTVAVILVNYNTPVHTANCINSLNTYSNAADFDILVIDNGSADGSLQILQAQFPALRYIDNHENLGFAEGNNKGLEYSIAHGYTYSLLINTDTLVDEDLISALVSHLNTHPEAAAVQPAIFWLHNRAKLWNGPCYFNSFIGKPYSKTKDSLQLLTAFQKVAWVTGCCILVRNAALQKAGMFNKTFFLYYEDVELSLRLRQNGYELHYLPTSKMYHEAGASGKSASKQKEGFLNPMIHFYISRNHIWFLRRYGNALFYPFNLLFYGFYYAALLAYFMLRGKNKKAGLLVKGIKDGLFTPQSLIWPKN